MRNFYSTSFLAAASLFSSVAAWGSLGHQLTGAVAQKLISPDTYKIVKQLLPAEWKGNMSRSATWADEVKRKAGYAGWSAPLHFVDIQDNPSKSCTPYNAERDCANGKCLVGAIANYTSRLDCSHSQDERSEALKFLIHFLGDITQPLHTCGRMVGGNSAKIAVFDRRHTLNLHTLWDTTIIEKRVKEDFGKSGPRYLDFLLTQLKTTYKSAQAAWPSCLDASAPNSRRRLLRRSGDADSSDAGSSAEQCAIEWASDSEGINCDTVWPAYDNDPSQDFGTDYYTQAYPSIEQQLLKAGVRMARFFELNLQAC